MQLVIQKPGTYITQKDEIFRLKNKEAKLDVSPLKVESIVITNKASITSQAVVLALEHNIDVIFLDGFGFPLGRIWFAKTGSTAMIRRRQLEAAGSDLGLMLVKEMVVQKMENQIRFLKKLMHARPGKEALFTDAIGTIAKESGRMQTENQALVHASGRMRGWEGSAGRAYFQCLSKIMPSNAIGLQTRRNRCLET